MAVTGLCASGAAAQLCWATVRAVTQLPCLALMSRQYQPRRKGRRSNSSGDILYDANAPDAAAKIALRNSGKLAALRTGTLNGAPAAAKMVFAT